MPRAPAHLLIQTSWSRQLYDDSLMGRSARVGADVCARPLLRQVPTRIRRGVGGQQRERKHGLEQASEQRPQDETRAESSRGPSRQEQGAREDNQSNRCPADQRDDDYQPEG